MSVPQQSSATSVCLLALGSPHGDDAIAWEVARVLEEQGGAANNNLQIERLETGWDLLNCLSPLTPTILIDACQSGRDPGSVFEVDRQELDGVHGTSSHTGPMCDILALAEQLGKLPDRFLIVGIEPFDSSPGEGLSQPARAAIPLLCDRIREQIAAWTGANDHA